MKVAFVRNPKTGSSSMMRCLPTTVYNESHYPARDYFRPGLVTFSFIRNPWERAHSWWRHQNYCKTESFRDYIMRRARAENYIHGRWDMGLKIHDQYMWVCHEDQYVDHIGRFENLVEDFTRLVPLLGIELTMPFPHMNKSIRRETYPYDPAMWDAEMVAHMDPLFGPFAEEFNYTAPC